jgi:protein PhnA
MRCRDSANNQSLASHAQCDNYAARMSKPACPMCETTDVLEHPDRWECLTCGHEWPREAEADAPEAARVVKDAHGTVLADGDCVTLIKDLKLKGSTQVIKGGTKSKPIRLVDGDHEISCKMDGIAIGLKACFVKKA